MGSTDIAIVVSNVAGVSSVAADQLRTVAGVGINRSNCRNPKKADETVSVPAASPIVVGTRVFVPLRDELGTIYEFDLTTGTRRGRIRLGQPVGQFDRGRPGTGRRRRCRCSPRIRHRRRARDDDGNPPPSRCVQVIATGHSPGTLRTPPLLIGPEGTRGRTVDDPVAGIRTRHAPSRFRRFADQPPPLDGKAPPEVPATAAVGLPISGWSWFPAVNDGERIAVATDFGSSGSLG